MVDHNGSALFYTLYIIDMLDPALGHSVALQLEALTRLLCDLAFFFPRIVTWRVAILNRITTSL